MKNRQCPQEDTWSHVKFLCPTLTIDKCRPFFKDLRVESLWLLHVQSLTALILKGSGSACYCLCSQAVAYLLQPPRDVRSISATHHKRKGPVTLVLKMQNQMDRHLPSLCDPSGTQTSPLFLPHRVVQPRVCWKTGHSDRYGTWAGHALDMGPAIASQKAPSDHCYQVLIELFPEPAS